MISIRLPWPPSNNTYYRNTQSGTLISERGRSYRRSVLQHCLAQGIRRTAGPVRVVIHASPPDRRKRDLDNLLKGLLDSLTKAGAWDDDGLVDDLRIVRGEVKAGGEVLVSIEALA